ncbi:hypothetical protein GCM10009619_41250 [Williamsia maris]
MQVGAAHTQGAQIDELLTDRRTVGHDRLDRGRDARAVRIEYEVNPNPMIAQRQSADTSHGYTLIRHFGVGEDPTRVTKVGVHEQVSAADNVIEVDVADAHDRQRDHPEHDQGEKLHDLYAVHLIHR